MFLTVVTVVAGSRGWESIQDFGGDNLDWLKQYGNFENGIPVYDTIARGINLVTLNRLQSSFSAWMKGYLLAVKGNQERLKQAISRAFNSGMIRVCWVILPLIGLVLKPWVL